MATLASKQAQLATQRAIRWRAGAVLLGACLVGVVLVLPYQLAAIHLPTTIPFAVILVASVVQSAVLFGIAIALGLWLGPKVGLGAPGLEAWLRGQREVSNLWQRFRMPILLGISAALLVILLSIAFPLNIAAVNNPTWWQGLLASFYGGIAEEVLTRVGLMTILAYIIGRVCRGADERPAAGAMWVSIISAAVLFGAAHLPFAATLVPLTPRIVLTVIVLNAVAGIAFGWLYWRRGLGAAMIAHFSADLVLHVAVPLVVAMFGINQS